jgi:hypothetical protein
VGLPHMGVVCVWSVFGVFAVHSMRYVAMYGVCCGGCVARVCKGVDCVHTACRNVEVADEESYIALSTLTPARHWVPVEALLTDPSDATSLSFYSSRVVWSCVMAVCSLARSRACGGVGVS